MSVATYLQSDDDLFGTMLPDSILVKLTKVELVSMLIILSKAISTIKMTVDNKRSEISKYSIKIYGEFEDTMPPYYLTSYILQRWGKITKNIVPDIYYPLYWIALGINNPDKYNAYNTSLREVLGDIIDREELAIELPKWTAIVNNQCLDQ